MTPAKLMQEYALYKDDQNRVYRPRIKLTEYENEAETDEFESERYIYFDAYIKPRSKKTYEKGDVPISGEIIRFTVIDDIKSDTVTIKEFTGEIEEVRWGTLLTLNEFTGALSMTENENLGLVKVKVHGSYPRSLILDSDYRIKYYNRSLAA